MNNPITKQYLKDIKLLFPIWGKEEKAFFQSFSKQVDEYLYSYENATLEDLYRDVGAPNEILNNYLSQTSISYLSKRICHTKHIKLALSILGVCIVLCCMIWSFIDIKEYHYYNTHQITTEETIIE